MSSTDSIIGGTMTPENMEAVDEAIYPELSRANLLRMRGDYDGAEAQCMAILRRFPNSATTNALLGDISGERGSFEVAVQWYELALQADSNLGGVASKLDAVKIRIKDRDTAASAEQFGLPPAKGFSAALPIAVVVLVAIIGGTAYTVGSRAQNKPQPVVGRIEAPLQPTATTASNNGLVGSQPVTAQTLGASPVTAPATAPASLDASSDKGKVETDLASVVNSTPMLQRVTEAFVDPRNSSVTLGFDVQENEDPKVMATKIATAVFDKMPGLQTATIRALSNSKLIFTGEVSRAKYEASLVQKLPEGQEVAPDFLLENQWPGESKSSGTTTPSKP